MLERDVRVPRHTGAASLGAMLLAAAAIGRLTDLTQAASAANPVAAGFHPRPAEAARYRALYREYDALYEALRPTFRDLAAQD